MKTTILNLRAEGLTYREICLRLGCAKSTVAYHCGQSQKEKTNQRNQKYRRMKILAYKWYRFKGKALRDKCYDFQRRVGAKLTTRSIVFKIDDFLKQHGEHPQCYLTGRTIDLNEPKTYQFDHIIPATRGGTNDLTNLGLACKQANICKSDLTVEELLQLCREILEHHGYSVNKQ